MTSTESTPSTVNLAAANDFFEPISLWRGPASPSLKAALADAPAVAPNNDSVFTSSKNGLVSCILAEEEVDPTTQTILDTQKQNLINLTGVASAFVRNQADVQKNPNLVYDTTLWQNVYNHLPLMGPSQMTQEVHNETVRGVEVATSFLELLVGFATGAGPALAGFSTFLTGLGTSIKAGVQTTGQQFHTASIGIVLETQKIGSKIEVQPWLKAYFIDFTQAEQKLYSSCASYDSFAMNFSYRKCESLFNFGALTDATVGMNFNAFIHGTQLDDIKNASNFFGTTVTKKSS